MDPARSRWTLFDALATQRRFIYLAVVLLSAAGAWSALKLPSAIYPELTFAKITIVAQGSSLSARQEIFGVTRPIEEAVSIVPGVIRVRSRSIRGASEARPRPSPGGDRGRENQQGRRRLEETTLAESILCDQKEGYRTALHGGVRGHRNSRHL